MSTWPTAPVVGDIYVTAGGMSFTYTSQGTWRATPYPGNASNITTGTFPDGVLPNRLREQAEFNVIADANLATKQGVYALESTALNKPVADGGYLVVIAKHSTWYVQFFYTQKSDATTQVYRRVSAGVTLGGWERVYQTETEIAGIPGLGGASDIASVTGLQSALDLKAPLASPALTGNPTAPTQAVGNNSTRLATTAFVTAALSAQTHSNATTTTSGFMSSTDKVKLDGMNAGKSLPQMWTEPGNSGGSRRYMRLATVNGFSATSGAAITFMMANAGDYGTPRRGTSIVHFTERADVVNVQAFQLDHENIQEGPILYTVRTGLYQYELWGLFADHNQTLYIYPLSIYNGVITGDGQTITAPANLSTANVYQNDIWHEGNFNPSLFATLASPALTGTPTAPTAAAGTNTTQIATTAFVTNAVTAATGGAVTIASVTGLQPALDSKAPLASPALTGTPTAPTAAAGTNTTQVATTAFVSTAVSALVNSAPAALDTLNELSAALGNDANFASTMTTALAAKAPLASPTFTGVPAGPTAAAGTNTTQLATTAFVSAAVASTTNASNLSSGTIPDARLPDYLQADCSGISDWNTAIYNGWYRAENGANAPTSGSGHWYMGYSLYHGAGYSYQLVRGYGGAPEATYERQQQGGIWGAWNRVYQTSTEIQSIVSGGAVDPWAAQPIGAIIHLDVGEGITPPPTDKAYRYIDLTAGLTGAGGYNNGVLTSESVSGLSPDITATAVVSLAGSPLNGQTIRLLNTERRFIRPGSAGTLEDSQNLNHNHGGNTGSKGAQDITLTTTYGDGNAAKGYVRATGSYAPTNPTVASIPAHSHTISGDGGPEARPRNIGVKLYRRIK